MTEIYRGRAESRKDSRRVKNSREEKVEGELRVMNRWLKKGDFAGESKGNRDSNESENVI